jgi:hypothetical protein
MPIYAARCWVHPDRFGVRKSGVNRLFVLHTSEGGETGESAEALCGFMGQPKQTYPNGSVNLASYHYVVDTDRIHPAVPEDVVAYSAAGANHDGVHACFPGKAGQTRDQWLDVNSRAMIRQAAALIVDRCPPNLIPVVQVTVRQVQAGASGVCDHKVISDAYKRSTHTDVGAGFPWDVLWADVAELTAIPEIPKEVEMEPPYVIVPEGTWVQWWYPHLLVPTADRHAVVTVTGEKPVNAGELTCSDEGQYRRRCHQAGIQLDTDKP